MTNIFEDLVNLVLDTDPEHLKKLTHIERAPESMTRPIHEAFIADSASYYVSEENVATRVGYLTPMKRVIPNEADRAMDTAALAVVMSYADLDEILPPSIYETA